MKYRIAHFMPDFVSGARYPIAALVTSTEGTKVVRCPRLPGPACLGSMPRAAAARLVVEALEREAEFESVPASAGPHVVFGEVRSIPSKVGDVEEWLCRVMGSGLPHSKEGKEPSRSSQRRSRGWRFFESWKVHQFVRKGFNPALDYHGWLAERAAVLSPISHWVPGRNRIMLMEPICPGRESLKKDLEEVGQRMLAYHDAIGRALVQARPATRDLVVYVLKGGADDVRAEATRRLVEALPAPDFTIVDTANIHQSTKFLEDVRTVGSTATPDLFTPEG